MYPLEAFMALLILVWWMFTTPTNGKGGLGESIVNRLIIRASPPIPQNAWWIILTIS